MFTKFSFVTLIATLAFSAFSADTQAGRYRTEGPTNSGDTSAQTGRYRVASDFAVSNNTGSYANAGQENSWAQVGRNTQAGRYRPSQSNFAPIESFAHDNDSEYARTRTQRPAAVDVSNIPANRAKNSDSK